MRMTSTYASAFKHEVARAGQQPASYPTDPMITNRNRVVVTIDPQTDHLHRRVPNAESRSSNVGDMIKCASRSGTPGGALIHDCMHRSARETLTVLGGLERHGRLDQQRPVDNWTVQPVLMRAAG